MPLRRFYRSQRSSEQALLTLYHHRRTSGCYASYIPSKTSEVTELGRKIPDRAALERLREMGFTTIVVHRQQLRTLAPRLIKKLDRAASRASPLLRRLHASESLVAYELVALP